MHSAIYRGYVRHRRFTPHAHRFSYQVFMMYLDLDELDKVFAVSPFWSRKPWRPARFERSDFLGDPAVPLKRAVQQRIHDETGLWHEGPIRMLANLRYFGFNINPISCYYCFDGQEALQFIVVEVTNTPWNERQSYVIQCDPMDATMALKRRDINGASLAGILLQHPWMTAKVALTIYWQALKLWVKRNPFYDHPKSQNWEHQDQSTITRLKTKT
jgi:DUF1365 family protein